uniref:Tr-type G domain-containing protein n=1 Tax=viral metagenome TaxID=1070528 RepID=A0A6C0HXW8_9ZZZZ
MINKDEEISIVVCGPVDAGKSSLVGVLTTGNLDDGRGLARKSVFHHNHELETGRTSSISQNVIKYENVNGVLKLINTKTNRKYEPRIVETIDMKGLEISNNKVVSLIDLAGHEKYLKTTVSGITGMFPDRGIVVIGANTGITKLTREHIGLLLCVRIPFMVVITKIDMAPEQIYLDLQITLRKLLQRNAPDKTLFFINNDTLTNDYINIIDNQNIVPVISVSNKNGYNINNLHRIIYKTPQRDKFVNQPSKGTLVYLDGNFSVPGIGLVVSGMIKEGSIKVKQKMFIGPYDGQFVPIIIRSIHNNLREDVSEIGSNVQGCFAIKFIDTSIPRSSIKKGFVLIDNINSWKNNLVKSFVAKIKILHHSSAIETGYCPVVHCGPIKQSAYMKLLNIDSNSLKSGDSSIVSFTFANHPELIEENMIMFFRDGTTKGVGEVVNLIL